MVAGCSAAVAFVAWRVWQKESEIKIYRRTLGDVLLTYRCERGETFRAKGQVEALKCPSCGRPAYAVTSYFCPTHEEQDVAVQFKLDEHGEAVMSKTRVLPNGPWTDAELGVRCGKCGELMTRQMEDGIDLSRLRRFDGEGTPRRPVPTDAGRPKGEDPDGSNSGS